MRKLFPPGVLATTISAPTSRSNGSSGVRCWAWGELLSQRSNNHRCEVSSGLIRKLASLEIVTQPIRYALNDLGIGAR